jgi:hypothetical protein
MNIYQLYETPTADAVKYIHSQIDTLTQPFSAEFNETTCLEHRLDRRQTDYIPDNTNNVKLMLAVSGAGKTRLLLELLHSRPGYYFVSTKQDGDFGSGDLAECNRSAQKHPDHVSYFITLLYFVRVTVCNYLVDLGYSKPHQLLLAQLHPKQFFGTDIFEEVFVSLTLWPFVLTQFDKYFDFVAIDDIQGTLQEEAVFDSPHSENRRPFYSPLVYNSKRSIGFRTFIVSGTVINFEYQREMIESSAMKMDIVTDSRMISSLKPLTASQVAAYSRKMLADSHIAQADIDTFVQIVSAFPQCHGRARFIAFIIEQFLDCGDVELALSRFTLAVSDVDNTLCPLRLRREDLQSPNRCAGVDTRFVLCFFVFSFNTGGYLLVFVFSFIKGGYYK